MTGDRPTGQRYSFVYLEPGSPIHSSPTLQRRASSFFSANYDDEAYTIVQAMRQELGARLDGGHANYAVSEWLEKARADEFIDAVTVIAHALRTADLKARSSYRSTNFQAKWVAFVERAAREENWKYEVDTQGGVHPRIDPIFAAERGALLSDLGHRRYTVAREHFEEAHRALDDRPPATGRAIREIFLANETVFKMLSPDSKSLDASEANRRLGPLLEGILEGPELFAARETTKGLIDYVNGSHQYRHAQAGAHYPSLETTVMMVSIGSAWLRWLISIDRKISPSEKTPAV